MAANMEKIQAEIQKIREEIKKASGKEGADKRALRLQTREMRKLLKRKQRKLSAAKPMTQADRLKRLQKLLENVTAQQSELQKNTKKKTGDPNVHSFSKKVRSLNRRIKKINRIMENHKAPEAPAAAAPQPPTQPQAAAPAQ